MSSLVYFEKNDDEEMGTFIQRIDEWIEESELVLCDVITSKKEQGIPNTKGTVYEEVVGLTLVLE